MMKATATWNKLSPYPEKQAGNGRALACRTIARCSVGAIKAICAGKNHSGADGLYRSTDVSYAPARSMLFAGQAIRWGAANMIFQPSAGEEVTGGTKPALQIC